MSSVAQSEQVVDFISPDCGAMVEVSVSRFRGSSGVDEYHLMARPTEYGSFAEQLEWVRRAYQAALRSVGLEAGTCVLRRFFCSDLPNQAAVLEGCPLASPDGDRCAVSVVCQPPAAPAKVGLWAYHISGELDKAIEGRSVVVRRGELAHVWTVGVTCVDGDGSYGQARGILEAYDSDLESRGMRLADHVARTWFFVENVDANYQGLVAARREFFAEHGMTPDTHFIASTGIEGTSASVEAKVTMDAYAIGGLRGEQVQFLCAPEHLSPTHIYGVTFERGVSIAYQDRKHVMISGTASIDHAGKIVHPGDVLRQLDRTLENVEALLQQADAALRDVCMAIVYVRDASDVDVARRAVRERLGGAPVQVVVARVCRPGWLIEVECQAIVAHSDPALPAF